MTDSRAAAWFVCAVLLCGCVSRPVPPPPAPRAEREAAGFRHLLHRPRAYESRQKWPLILFLHGDGERGDDLALVRREGLPRILDTLPDFPFVVVSPQLERRRSWSAEALGDVLDEVVAANRVDPDRIYVTGLSSGASASLEMAILYPGRFAAVAAVTSSKVPAGLCGMKEVPVWIFHNSGDERIPAGRAKRLVRALEACGGEVRFTLFPRDGHDAWTEAYRTQELYDWFLAHRRRGAR